MDRRRIRSFALKLLHTLLLLCSFGPWTFPIMRWSMRFARFLDYEVWLAALLAGDVVRGVDAQNGTNATCEF